MRVLADKGRHQHRQDANRCDGQPRPGRGIAHLGLQPLRQDQVDAEEAGIATDHDQRADAEIAVGKQAQVDDRVLVGHFPDDEKD